MIGPLEVGLFLVPELTGNKLAEDDMGGFGHGENPVAKSQSASRNERQFHWILVMNICGPDAYCFVHLLFLAPNQPLFKNH